MAEHMISVEEARAIVLAHITPTDAIEVETWRAVGLPLAEDITTDIDLSPFANSAMDGYAVHSEDLAAATSDAPVILDVVGHEAAGHVFDGVVQAGQAVRIMTGAPVPEGLDAVVKYEIVDVLDGDGNEGSRIAFTRPAKVGENIREAGLEARAGECILAAGEMLTSAGAGLAASAGHEKVAVRRAPVVGVLSVGTELVGVTDIPARGQIRDANATALLAAALEAGAEPRFFGIARDDEAAIAASVHEMVASCDFVITSGGASAGDYDYIEALVRREGEVLFDRISMRPGKAITFGILLFIVPVDLKHHCCVMEWKDARKLPWGILLLFGGGLSLAGTINSSGLATWMADILNSLQHVPFVVMLFILVIVVQLLTECTSNTATAAAFLPLAGIMAAAQGMNPAAFAIPAAVPQAVPSCCR